MRTFFRVMGIVGMVIVCTGLAACAKHGMMIETGKDYKGRITAGWGPMTVLDADVAGQFRACIPSKDAVKGSPSENWCRSWLAHELDALQSHLNAGGSP